LQRGNVRGRDMNCLEYIILTLSKRGPRGGECPGRLNENLSVCPCHTVRVKTNPKERILSKQTATLWSSTRQV